jgi:hypothetical protein
MNRYGDTLRKLAPFISVARGIPDNWPGKCILRFYQRDDGSLYLGYYGINAASGGITIDQWRALLGANAPAEAGKPSRETGRKEKR